LKVKQIWQVLKHLFVPGGEPIADNSGGMDWSVVPGSPAAAGTRSRNWLFTITSTAV